MAKIGTNMNALSARRDSMALRKVFLSLRTDIVNLATALDVLATKLNSDTGVGDTNYAHGNVSAITTEE